MFKVCGSLPKAVTWQSGTESRAFIHLDSATPMMSVTDDCETLPSLSPHSQIRSPRAGVKEGGVEDIITSINEAPRTMCTAGSPDLVSKATSACSFVL